MLEVLSHLHGPCMKWLVDNLYTWPSMEIIYDGMDVRCFPLSVCYYGHSCLVISCLPMVIDQAGSDERFDRHHFLETFLCGEYAFGAPADVTRLCGQCVPRERNVYLGQRVQWMGPLWFSQSSRSVYMDGFGLYLISSPSEALWLTI